MKKKVKYKKKTISIVLVLILMVSLCSSAFAVGEETITIEEYETALKEGLVNIIGVRK